MRFPIALVRENALPYPDNGPWRILGPWHVLRAYGAGLSQVADWSIGNIETGVVKQIGPARGRGVNYYDRAYDEVCKRNDAYQKKQEAQVTSLRNQRYAHNFKPVNITVDDLFKHPPVRGLPDGDFTFNDSVPGDKFAWFCAEDDCPVHWHTCLYYRNMGRENGKRWIKILHDSFADGDAQPYLVWDEREGMTPDDAADILEFESNLVINYLQGWLGYWLYVASTALDPLKQLSSADAYLIRNLAIKSAEELIGYLDQLSQAGDDKSGTESCQKGEL